MKYHIKLSVVTSILLAVLLFLPHRTSAQITIAPTSIFMDNQNRFGTMMVLNGSEQAQEVTIEFQFGYLGANDEGNAMMIYEDEEAEQAYSIADRVRGFPRSFTLQPGQRQVVRLTVANTGDLPDGTYWTRVKTISNPLSPPIEAQAQEGVTAQINFRFEQVTSAFFKKGNVTTGLDIPDINARVTENVGYITTTLRQTGNSPYIGRMRLRVLDPNGNMQVEQQQSVAIYFDTKRLFNFDASRLSPGRYTAELTFETRRSDMSVSDLVQAEPVTRRVTFQVQ